MAMESVLKQLETRIEELVESYRGAITQSEELEAKVVVLQNRVNHQKSHLF